MTDKQIIKALECCADIGINACDDCPFQERCLTGEFIETEAVGLINSQKAEVESANKRADMWHGEAELNAAELIKMQAEIERLNRDYSTAVETMSESIRKANAEVERFKKIETTVNAFWSELQKITTFKKKSKPTLEELLEYMENLKAEAIKELINRVGETSFYSCDEEFVYMSDIIIVGEEMVGDAK